MWQKNEGQKNTTHELTSSCNSFFCHQFFCHMRSSANDNAVLRPDFDFGLLANPAPRFITNRDGHTAIAVVPAG
jgi:hypothetical protein